jgi:hypothetical protein
MTAKQALTEVIRQAPDDISLDDLVEEVWLYRRLLQADEDIEQGRTYTLDEARQRLSKWLK